MAALVLAMPVWLGGIMAMALTTAGGLLVYALANKFISHYQSHELKDPITSLFRMVGILVSLMLSLAFTEVISEWKAVNDAIDREAMAINDVIHGLKLYDDDGAREIQKKMIDYTRSIIDDEWPALAQDRLGRRTTALRQQCAELVLGLTPANDNQKEIRTAIMADLDVMSDYRIVRLNHALVKTPVYVVVILFGFFVSMACFGAYRPQVPLIALVSLYTAFIGLVLYLVMSLSDPFVGGYVIEPTRFEYLIEVLRSSK